MEEENQVFQTEVIDDSEFFEEIKKKRQANDIKTGDIITMQCIICIILAIIVVMINMLLPKISNQIIEKYKSETTISSDVNDTLVAIVSKISDFVNSTPNDRV